MAGKVNPAPEDNVRHPSSTIALRPTKRHIGNKAQLARLAKAWHFGRVAGGRAVQIAFIGVWDTERAAGLTHGDTWQRPEDLM